LEERSPIASAFRPPWRLRTDLAGSYFLLAARSGRGCSAAQRCAVVALVTFVVMLPALGGAMVKPSVVGTTARASNENVRSIGYSIYYTLVNIGGHLAPISQIGCINT